MSIEPSPHNAPWKSDSSEGLNDNDFNVAGTPSSTMSAGTERFNTENGVFTSNSTSGSTETAFFTASIGRYLMIPSE